MAIALTFPQIPETEINKFVVFRRSEIGAGYFDELRFRPRGRRLLDRQHKRRAPIETAAYFFSASAMWHSRVRHFPPRRIGVEFLGSRAGIRVHARLLGGGRPPPMSTKKQPSKSASCSSLTVPELDQSKMAVLNMLASAHSRRSYKHAIEKFIAWYCSEPRLGFNRSVVVRCGAV